MGTDADSPDLPGGSGDNLKSLECPCCGLIFDEAYKDREGKFCSRVCMAAYAEDIELYLDEKRTERDREILRGNLQASQQEDWGPQDPNLTLFQWAAAQTRRTFSR